MDKVIGYFLDGKLLSWLEARYYDTEADAVRALDKDDANVHRRLCEIFGVEYHAEEAPKIDVEAVEERNRRLSDLTVLLSSRSLVKEEMEQILLAMRRLFPTQIRYEIRNAIQSELEQYVGPQHGKLLLRLHWELNHAIERQLKISLRYQKVSGEIVERKVTPVSVVSSEQYLYLVAFLTEKKYRYPAFFRLDRIEEVGITDEHYSPKLYSDYNMGRMKNCIQFMYAGELLNVKLACTPEVVEPVRDRLPNSRIAGKDGERTIITARVFGEGFLHWAMQYGGAIEVLEPESLREKMEQTAESVWKLYRKEN